jgi:hypothetical protein
MKRHKKRKSYIKDHPTQVLFVEGLITVLLFSFWIYTLWSRQGELPWYTYLLGGSTTSFFVAFVVMYIQNLHQKKINERNEFFRSLKEHGIENMHHNKKDVLISWIRNAKKEVYITGYRQILTLSLLDDLLFALNNSKELKIMILACPPWMDTYKRIFNDDTSINYIALIKKLKDKVPDFNRRIFIRFTEKPLFNDTYIIDHHLITSPYVHNRVKTGLTPDIITADQFFSLEVADDSNLFNFFKEDFMAVWETADSLNEDFELFTSCEIKERLIKTKDNITTGV